MTGPSLYLGRPLKELRDSALSIPHHVGGIIKAVFALVTIPVFCTVIIAAWAAIHCWVATRFVAGRLAGVVR